MVRSFAQDIGASLAPLIIAEFRSQDRRSTPAACQDSPTLYAALALRAPAGGGGEIAVLPDLARKTGPSRDRRLDYSRQLQFGDKAGR